MASALSPKHLLARLFMKHFVHDPGTTNACLASPDGGTTPYYVDMSTLECAAISVAPSIVGGNGITLVRVFASEDVAGATHATLVRTSGAIQLDNLDGAANSGGDVYRTEVTAEEIVQLGAASGYPLRYLTIEITHATNTDESTVEVVGEGRFEYSGQSGTVQA